MASVNRSTQRVVYVLQGGGALGAYQVGIFQALSEHGYEPDLIGGSSIGAINGSIIAGNKREDRLQKVKEFWERITTRNLDFFPDAQDINTRRWLNYLSAQQTLLFGQPGFFAPRVNNPLFITDAPPDEISFYVLDPLRKTLDELIDFDRINTGKPHLILQSVEVSHGKPVFFDNRKHKIDARHIMASGALPPGFPAVEIDGHYYWDGGVISHMPLEYVMDSRNVSDILCFTANLFDSYGLIPRTLDDVLRRHKDITYSSRYRTNLKHNHAISKLRHVIRSMYDKMSEDLKNDPAIIKLSKFGRDQTKHFVHFLYSAQESELSSKDYEFSTTSLDERIAEGYHHGILGLKKSPWLEPVAPHIGVAVHDISTHPDFCK